jgi:hypothetical protein
MTELLNKAFEEAQKLPEKSQDELAQQVLKDIGGESKWDETLGKSQDLLAALADKAREDFKAGRTKKIGFDEL